MQKSMQEQIDGIVQVRKSVSHCLEVGQYRAAVMVAKKSALTEWLFSECRKIIRDYVEKGQNQLLRIFIADMSKAWPEKREDLFNEVVAVRSESCKL